MSDVQFLEENGHIRCVPGCLLPPDLLECINRYMRGGFVPDFHFYPLIRALKAESISYSFSPEFHRKLEQIKKKYLVTLGWEDKRRFFLQFDAEQLDPILKAIASRFADVQGKIKEERRLGNLLKKLKEKGAGIEITSIAQMKLNDLKRRNTVALIWKDGWVHIQTDKTLRKALLEIIARYTEGNRLSDPLLFFQLKKRLDEREGWVEVEDAVLRFLKDYGKSHISVIVSQGYFKQIEIVFHPSSFPEGYRKVLAPYMDDWHLLKDYRELEVMTSQLRSAGCSVRVDPEVLHLIQENAHIALGNLSVALKHALYPFQRIGALFLVTRQRAILADDMGLGKTVQALAGISQLLEQKRASRALIFCPASLKYQWVRECEKFTDLTYSLITGNKIQREEAYAKPAQVYVVNYELLLRDFEHIAPLAGEIIVIDEAQRIKNYQTQTHKRMKQLPAKYVFALTGTPIENELMELYTILRFVSSDVLGTNVRKFMQRYVIRNFFGGIQGYRYVDEVRKRVSSVILRRTKKEVLQELPDVVENIYWVEMTEQQQKFYREIRNKLSHLLSKKQFWSKRELHQAFEQLTYLREVCDSAELLDEEKKSSAKISEILQILDELLRTEHKILIFSQWEKMTRIIERELEKKKISCVRFYGELSDKQRQVVLDTFNERADIPIFLSTDAGAYGVNLQVADVVINFDLPYNPARLEQRIARAHRFGQKKTVNVLHLITPRSVESGMLRLLYRKKKLFQDLIEKLDTREVLETAPEAAELIEQLLQG